MAHSSGPSDFTWVLDSLRKWVKEDPEIALAMAAYRALNEVVKKSKEETTHGLIDELQAATNFLVQASSNISLKSVAQIYMYFITGASRNFMGKSFQDLKKELIARGRELEERTQASREQISTLAYSFFRDGMIVMVHGYSRVVFSVLKLVANREKRIKVIQTESSPQNNGIIMAQRLAAENIPVQIITDSAAAHMMDQVDMVFVGAEAVVENGGIINNVGTYQLAVVAKALHKPFYVAAETFKMTHDYPLDQQGIPNQSYGNPPPLPLIPKSNQIFGAVVEECQPEWMRPTLDYTPPQYITLLFTDLSVLTPSAVSDELIKFDQVLPEPFAL